VQLKRISFDYGNFEYTNETFNDGFDRRPIIKGKFNLNLIPIKKDFQSYFWFYDHSKIDLYKWIKGKENRNYKKLYCLGPYFSFWVQDALQTVSPVYTDIILNSKTRKILEVMETNWSTSYKYERTEGRKQQLKILSNFYANYLKSVSIELQGTFIPVPSRPSYSFNSVDIISSEFAKVFNLPHDESLFLRPSDENKYLLRKEPLSKFYTIFDDVYTDGKTKNILSDLLINKGITNIEIVCLGKRDHSNYYNLKEEC
jgi:hypothetical protein